MKKEFEKEIPTNYAEGAISVLTVLNARSRNVETVYLSDPNKIRTDKKIGAIKRICDDRGIPFVICDKNFIDENAIGTTHGGLIALVGDRQYSDIKSVFSKKDGFVCLIEGIEDPYNFAYSVRSLYAAGVDGIILSERNWMSATGVCIRGSAGATELVDCAVYKDKSELISIARNAGYTIACADEKTDVLYTDPVLKTPLFLIVGGEKRGISAELMAAADVVVKIDYGRAFPMSLTAASATSILAFEVHRQNKM